jgi:hypothetical protein
MPQPGAYFHVFLDRPNETVLIFVRQEPRLHRRNMLVAGFFVVVGELLDRVYAERRQQQQRQSQQ